jgi:hypothetical protein
MNTRFALFLVSIAGALIAFKTIRNSWMAAGVIVGIFILSGIIELAVEAALQRTRAYPAHVYPYPVCLKKFVHS